MPTLLSVKRAAPRGVRAVLLGERFDERAHVTARGL